MQKKENTSKPETQKKRAMCSRASAEMAKTIGRRIADIREGMDMSQDDFCAKINVSKSTLSGYERGLRFPTIETLIAISKMKNKSIDFILQTTQEVFENSLEEELLLEIFNNTSKQNKIYIIEAARGIARVGQTDNVLNEDVSEEDDKTDSENIE